MPVGLDAFFPPEDGRQDLIHEQDFGLKAHAPALRAARRAAGKSALLGAYLDLFLGEYGRARKTTERLAKASPKEYWPNFLHAMSLWLLGDRLRTRALLPEALEAADKAVAADPKAFYPYVLRGGLRREIEDVPGALADAERALKIRPDFVWSRVERLELLGGEGDYRAAMKDANLLLRRYPREAWAWAQRARLKGLSGRYAQALEDFEKAVALEPKNGPMLAWRSETQRRLGRYREAEAGLDRAITLDPRYRLAYQWRGRIRLLRGRCEEAVKDFDRTLALEPRERLVGAWRGEAWWKLGKHRRAAEDFEQMLPAGPAGLWNARLRAAQTQETFYMLDSIGGRRLEAFRADLEDGAAKAPFCPWARAFRGRGLLDDGRVEEGLSELDAALALDGKNGYALSWRGEGLRRLGRREEALAALDRAAVLARGVSGLWAWARLGLVLSELGRDAEAVVAFERALKPGDQRFACAWIWKAEALRRQGRGKDALAAGRRAFALDPKCGEVKEWLGRYGGRRVLTPA